MQYSPERKTVYITVDELMNLGMRSGSIAEPEPVFEKSKQSLAMCDTAAERDPEAEQYAGASCRISYKGITYAITACAELLKRTGNTLHIFSFASQGGRESVDDDFKAVRATRLCAVCAVFSKAYGYEVDGELIIKYAPRSADAHYAVDMSANELYSCLDTLIHRAAELIYFEIERKDVRIKESAAAKFPFPKKREGQSDFMIETYRSMKDGTRLLCEAPTGIGKTVSALFPSVRALGNEYIDKLFYFTPKTTAQLAADNALKAISGGKLCVRSVSMTAKEKLCSHKRGTESTEASESFPITINKCETCPLSHGFYGLINITVFLSSKS